MSITVKESLAKYGVSAERYNAAFDGIMKKGIGEICDTQALIAVIDTLPPKANMADEIRPVYNEDDEDYDDINIEDDDEDENEDDEVEYDDAY